jgi:hypothetical protein
MGHITTQEDTAHISSLISQYPVGSAAAVMALVEREAVAKTDPVAKHSIAVADTSLSPIFQDYSLKRRFK